jgi:exonuclease III
LKENGDIALLRETHSTPETEELWKNECGCESFLTWHKQFTWCYDIFSNKLKIEVTEKITDTEGRFLLLKCIIQGTKIIIYNVYAPNNEKDHVAFLLFLKEKLDIFGHKRV